MFSKGDNITVKCDFSLSSSEKLNNTEFYKFDYKYLREHSGNFAKKNFSNEVFTF